MNRITRKDWLLLSRYLDGDLSDEQQRQIENRLRSDAFLKDAYERLLHTRQVLRSVPQRKVPRNYTLDPSQVRIREPRWRPVILTRYASVAAGLVAVVAMTLQLLTPGFALPRMASEEATYRMLSESADAVEAPASDMEPPIIVWNSGAANGIGGAGAGMDQQTAPQAVIQPPTEAFGMGGGGGAGPVEETQPLESMMAESVPEEEKVVEPEVEMLTKPYSNPILGIAPNEERGTISETPMATMLDAQPLSAQSVEQPQRVNFSLIAILAALLSAISAGISILLHKRQY